MALATAAPLRAADFSVSTNADAGAGSLRQAIADANAAGPGSHTITFDEGLDPIVLESELDPLTTDVTIAGSGTTVSGDNTYRIFRVSSGTTTLVGLTIADGQAQGGNGGGSAGGGAGGGGLGAGGAILIETDATVIVEDVALADNAAQGGAGGNVSGAPSSPGGGGGGIFEDGGAGGTTVAGTGGGGTAQAADGASGAGGGGGLYYTNASDGGDGGLGGGGGGGSGNFGTDGMAGGDGGFGGGGGGGGFWASGSGFAGGDGGAGGEYGGNGGTGASWRAYNSGGGGGGAGLGGHVFVMEGGSFVVRDGVTTTGGSTTGGAGGLGYDGFQNGSAGQGEGDGFFVMAGSSFGADVDDEETVALSEEIVGGGALAKSGAGTLVLSGANAYTGGTTISGGTLRGNTASLTGDILNNAALAFDQASDGTFSGAVSGTGTLEKTGAGVLTFTGENTYTGATTVSGGTLRAGNATGLASGAYTLSGGTLDLNDFDLSVSGLSGVSGTVDLGSAELEVDQDSDGVFGGVISGAGSLVKLGSGILTLTGENTYTGATTLSAGTLRAGNATGLASGGYVVDGGTLDLNDFDFSISSLSGTGGTVDLGSGELEVDQEDSDGIFGGVIAGAGTLVKAGSSILTLSGASTFFGGTTLAEGTLRLEHDDALGTGALTATGGTIDYDDGVDIANAIDLQTNTTLNVTTGSATQSGNIGETGGSFGIVKTGIGELTLTGNNSFTGGITINAGRLRGDTDSLLGDIDIANGTLQFDQAADGEFTGAITGTGTLLKTGEGEAVFSGSGIEADYFYVRGAGAVIDGSIVNIVNRLSVANSHESGEDTDASLTIRGGATVTSGEGYIGDIDDFSAAVTVSGAGTTWTVGDFMDPTQFFVAGEGETSLLIEDGAEVTVIGSAHLFSRNGGPAATVTVTGADSLFEVTETLRVGTAGTGHMTISNGGSVASAAAEIGRQSERTGVVSISGAGSQWLIDDTELLLGGDSDSVPGTGHITLGDGGLLELGSGSGTLYAAVGDASIARINIGAAEGDDAVAAGTLDVATIAFDDDGGGDGRLTFNHTEDDFEFATVLTGEGAISHLAGNTTLTGLSSTFTGVTSVSGGRLDVGGILGGSMTVANGRLGGSGTVGGTSLQGGGILSPGNSIGTLTVAGDLDFGDGSFYEVEVNDGGFVAGTNNDFIDVSGAVTIDSGASLFVSAANGTDDGSTYTPGNLYTLIAADGGVSGMFGAVGTSFAFLVPELSYDTNNVFLNLTQAADFEDAAVSQNQQAVAAALDALGSGNEIYDAVLLMTEEEARRTFDALTGEAHASTVTAFFLGAQQVREVLLTRLAALFGRLGNVASRDISYAPAAGDATPGAVTVWGQVFGGWGTTDEGAGTAALDRSSAGFLGGVDREIGSASRIGVAAGYSRSSFDVNGRASSGDSDNFHLAGYAGTKWGSVELKAALAYSYQMADTERTVLASRITGDYDAHTVQGSTEASIGFDIGSLSLTPFAGLSIVHIETESFTEAGGPGALARAATSNTTGITALGLRARQNWGGGDLFGSVAWRHAFGDVNSTSRAAFASNPSAPFVVRGAPLSEDVLALGAGVEIELGAASTLELSYSGELTSDSRDHGLKAKLRIDF